MKNKLRKIFSGEGFSAPAYFILRCGLVLSCLMLAASLLIAVYIGPPGLHNHTTYSLVAQLYREPQSVILVTSLGALIVDRLMKEGR